MGKCLVLEGSIHCAHKSCHLKTEKKSSWGADEPVDICAGTHLVREDGRLPGGSDSELSLMKAYWAKRALSTVF